ncbi:MAG: BLUF domain-containing protein [Bacteroidota bacterium]
MYYLIYVSYAVEPFSQDMLKELLEKCVYKNEKQGITGMLLYIEGKFIQVLEGEKNVIKKIFDNILKDERHRKIKIIIEGMISKRNFPNWSMGFKSINNQELKKMTGYTDIEEYFRNKNYGEEGHIALVFLKLFYQKNYPTGGTANLP